LQEGATISGHLQHLAGGGASVSTEYGACGEKSQIAGRTRIGGGVAGMLGSGIAVALTVRTSTTLCFAMAMLAYFVVGYLVSRLMLRLDPPELTD
jgi:hypothetical protein